MSTFSRRDFTKTSLLAAGILFFPGCKIKEEDPSYHFFTQDKAKCVIALCEQIIPADDQYGGATDAEVIYYIDRQLAGTFKDNATSYRNSIETLQEFCSKSFGKTFQNLNSEKQIEVMKLMEGNKIDKQLWSNPSSFFSMVLTHTMQGFYGSPIHGGNKDHMSFDMLKIDGMLKVRLESPSEQG
ncbi:MAG: gluconate 2-dehydrogenase subunit 3 family protein [Flavobacteriaceae bacterium]|nr:gluconate 2-dehydrogenase subunit 3 family protein [Flavobacteriaceae bacterium]